MPSFCGGVGERTLCNEDHVAASLPDYAAVVGLWFPIVAFAGWRTLGRRGLRISAMHAPVTAAALVLTSSASEQAIGLRLLGFTIGVLDACAHAIHLRLAAKHEPAPRTRIAVLNLLLGYTIAAAIPSILGVVLVSAFL